MIALLNYTNSTITQEREWALQLNREFYAPNLRGLRVTFSDGRRAEARFSPKFAWILQDEEGSGAYQTGLRFQQALTADWNHQNPNDRIEETIQEEA